MLWQIEREDYMWTGKFEFNADWTMESSKGFSPDLVFLPAPFGIEEE